MLDRSSGHMQNGSSQPPAEGHLTPIAVVGEQHLLGQLVTLTFDRGHPSVVHR